MKKGIKLSPYTQLLLTYINNSPSENSLNLLFFLEDVFKVFHVDPLVQSLTFDIFTLLDYFENCKNFEEAHGKLSVLEKHKPALIVPLNNAFDYVLGSNLGPDNHCMESCPLRKEKSAILGVGRLRGRQKLKCYECDYLFLQYLLNQITAGKEYGDITGLSAFLSFSKNLIKTSFKIISSVPRNATYRQQIITIPVSEINTSIIISLRFTIHGLLAYCLGDFLGTFDKQGRGYRNLLKRCIKCNDFFIARTFREQFNCQKCSPKSPKSKERRRQNQASYRKNLKMKNERQVVSKAIEENIERLMQALDMDEKQAKQWLKEWKQNM